MSRIVDYNDFPKEVRAAKALDDLREWLGEEQYIRLASELQRVEDTKENRAQLEIAFGLLGLPIKAFLNKYLGKNHEQSSIE